jgi:hypothetical protein
VPPSRDRGVLDRLPPLWVVLAGYVVVAGVVLGLAAAGSAVAVVGIGVVLLGVIALLIRWSSWT